MLTKLCRQERIRDSAAKNTQQRGVSLPGPLKGGKGMFTYKNTGN